MLASLSTIRRSRELLAAHRNYTAKRVRSKYYSKYSQFGRAIRTKPPRFDGIYNGFYPPAARFLSKIGKLGTPNVNPHAFELFLNSKLGTAKTRPFMNRPSSPQNGPQNGPQADVTPRNANGESPKSRPASTEGDVAGSIKQLLEMYQRSGLRWYLLPNGVRVQVKDLLQRYSGSGMLPSSSTLDTSSTSQPSASSTVPPATQSLKEVAASSTNAEPNKTPAAKTTTSNKPGGSPLEVSRPAAAKSPVVRTPIPQPTSWQLPVLTLEQREQNFTELRKKVAACQKCPELVNHRSQTVFGDGTLQPKVCFFGEAPGADEDKQGIPFVGKAGQLLDKIIEATKLKRPDDVYILNSLRCRPPGNRTPTPDEVENCRPFFELQLEVLQPKYIVCLGAVAVRAILQSTDSVGVLRGKFHAYRGAKVLVTYHPAYLLRNPDAKKLVWHDMQLLMADMGTQA